MVYTLKGGPCHGNQIEIDRVSDGLFGLIPELPSVAVLIPEKRPILPPNCNPMDHAKPYHTATYRRTKYCARGDGLLSHDRVWYEYEYQE